MPVLAKHFCHEARLLSCWLLVFPASVVSPKLAADNRNGDGPCGISNILTLNGTETETADFFYCQEELDLVTPVHFSTRSQDRRADYQLLLVFIFKWLGIFFDFFLFST